MSGGSGGRVYDAEHRARIIDGYVNWDPDRETQEALAQRLDTTKTTMMKLIAAAGVARKHPQRHHPGSWTT